MESAHHTPTVAFIEGDGTGPDIWRATQPILDEAVSRAYGGTRKIHWLSLLAGEKAYAQTGKWLPEETLEHIETHRIAIKGPLTTPVGEGFRSLNVTLRQELDLYACIRPVRYIPGVPSPMKNPQRVNMVVFRENNEDVYAGIEFASRTPEAEKLRTFLRENLGKDTPEESAIGIKPVSPKGSRRLIRMAIQYAIDNGFPSVTLMHKGNIMKFTEGGFREWGYTLAREEFAEQTVAEADLPAGRLPEGKVIIKDRIADNMFQQVLMRPEEYHVIATTNLNGDYISDALAAQVGGLGMAPGGNIGDKAAVFEATHGTAPKYAGQDKVNPSSLILSGAMMLEYLGWREAAERVREGLIRTIAQKTVTYDLARQMEGATEVKCSQFAEAIIHNM
ncbi:MAG: isocitrate dehydrogenase (NADP(+)) [Proteobacteria bacterium]|nr:isocitrate dehydrogenase (NADP(+)) [Pseudomonadota bacterium]